MERQLPKSTATVEVSGSLFTSFRRNFVGVDYRVYPLRLLRLQVPDYAVYDGFPSTTPQASHVVKVATSASGEIISDKTPEQINLDSTKRWFASTGFSSTTWLPVNPVTNESYYWSTKYEYAPKQITRMWSERVSGVYRSMTRTALSFPDGDFRHMWASFPIDNTDKFTLIFVVDPYESTDRYSIIDTGGPTPLEASLPENETLRSFTEPKDNRIYLHAVRQGNNTISEILAGTTRSTTAGIDIASQWPTVIALVGRSNALDMYTWNHNGSTPARNDKDNPIKTLSKSEGTKYSTNFLLGRANGTLNNCAGMALFEIAWWESALGDEEIIKNMGLLRAAYQTMGAS